MAFMMMPCNEDGITRREYVRLSMLATGALAAGAANGQTGSEKSAERATVKDQYDALIIGGGPAGLSAAMTLGRMLRTALVCDDNRPRNAPSAHLNNFLTRDGIHPALWREEARKNLEKYTTVEFFNGSVTSVTKVGESVFRAELSSGAGVSFRRVILAYGIRDTLPSWHGFKELWGKSIFHCPFCHGYETRGSALGLIANGDRAMHLAALCYGLSQDFILFTDGKADLTAEQKETLGRKKIRLEEGKISGFLYQGETLKAVTLEDGRSLEREALFAALVLPFQGKSDLGERLGCEKTEMGLYKVTELNETTIKGVFAAGDNMSRRHSVLQACSDGATAASVVVSDLLNETLDA